MIEFRLRETQVGYFIDVYLCGHRVIEGFNCYYKDVAEEIIKRLNKTI